MTMQKSKQKLTGEAVIVRAIGGDSPPLLLTPPPVINSALQNMVKRQNNIIYLFIF